MQKTIFRTKSTIPCRDDAELILKQARLVSSRREGKSIFYALADDHIYTIFRQALEHIAE